MPPPGTLRSNKLMAEQGTGPIPDVSVLHGDFWPEGEPVEEFVATIREWRGTDGLPQCPNDRHCRRY